MTLANLHGAAAAAPSYFQRLPTDLLAQIECYIPNDFDAFPAVCKTWRKAHELTFTRYRRSYEQWNTSEDLPLERRNFRDLTMPCKRLQELAIVRRNTTDMPKERIFTGQQFLMANLALLKKKLNSDIVSELICSLPTPSPKDEYAALKKLNSVLFISILYGNAFENFSTEELEEIQKNLKPKQTPLANCYEIHRVLSLFFSNKKRAERMKKIQIRGVERAVALREMDSSIARFISLKEITLSNCVIDTISPCLIQLKRLKILDLGNNCLHQFPHVITELRTLQRLNLNGNMIRQIPPLDMPKLEVLDLSENQIHELPDWNLPKLASLFLNKNCITRVRKSFLRSKKLAFLGLSNNQLTTANRFRHLSNLVHLQLNNNHLTKFPELGPKVSFLLLRGNPITQLPQLRSSCLYHLNIVGLPLSELPPQIELRNAKSELQVSTLENHRVIQIGNVFKFVKKAPVSSEASFNEFLEQAAPQQTTLQQSAPSILSRVFSVFWDKGDRKSS